MQSVGASVAIDLKILLAEIVHERSACRLHGTSTKVTLRLFSNADLELKERVTNVARRSTARFARHQFGLAR